MKFHFGLVFELSLDQGWLANSIHGIFHVEDEADSGFLLFSYKVAKRAVRSANKKCYPQAAVLSFR